MIRRLLVITLACAGLAGCAWFREPPEQGISTGATVVYNGGGFKVFSVCDKGNLVYTSEKNPSVHVVPGGCNPGAAASSSPSSARRRRAHGAHARAAHRAGGRPHVSATVRHSSRRGDAPRGGPRGGRRRAACAVRDSSAPGPGGRAADRRVPARARAEGQGPAGDEEGGEQVLTRLVGLVALALVVSACGLIFGDEDHWCPGPVTRMSAALVVGVALGYGGAPAPRARAARGSARAPDERRD